jgi:hypothetical protein
MAWRVARTPLLAACVLFGCSSPDPDVRPVEFDTMPPTQLSIAPHEAEFEAAAETVIAFLRGDAEFSALRLSDTVTFHLAPQSGGGRATISADELRDRAAWRIPSQFDYSYDLVPPAHLSRLTTRFGRHVRCFEYDLADDVPELARLPHVGTRLAPEDMSSCLQTWNLTFVFEADTMPPTLAAVVYDQWEW